MSNSKKIIYSLRICLELDKRGFRPISSMPNPYKKNFVCWIYDKTDSFSRVLDEIIGEK